MPAKKPSKKPAKKAPAKKAPKTSAARATRTAKRATAAAERAPAKRPSARADFGMPIDGFFAKKTGELGAIAKALRAMIEAAAPDAEASLKWGMPFFTIGKTPMCAIGVHAAHVNLILSGPASAYPDPDALLRGVGATGRHLKLTRLADLPQKTVSTWLSAAAKHARGA